MIDEKIARVKALIQKREEIDAELGALFGGAAPAKRGRPRKLDGQSISSSITASETEGSSYTEEDSSSKPTA
jgi:hypothetical protein